MVWFLCRQLVFHYRNCTNTCIWCLTGRSRKSRVVNTSKSQGAWDPTVYGCVYNVCVCMGAYVHVCMSLCIFMCMYVRPGVCYVCVHMSLYMLSDCLHTSTVYIYIKTGLILMLHCNVNNWFESRNIIPVYSYLFYTTATVFLFCSLCSVSSI